MGRFFRVSSEASYASGVHRSPAIATWSAPLRLLPPLAIALGLWGIVAAKTSTAVGVAACLVVCAAALELRGWGGALERGARAIAFAAALGAVIACVALVAATSLSDAVARIALR